MVAVFIAFLKVIRFSHTVFALPFALGSLFIAFHSKEHFSWKILILIVSSMALARTAAMSFNRFLDWEIDKRNPRTEYRHFLISRYAVGIACFVSSILFIGITYFINTLSFLLAPVALFILFFYSFTKYFTSFAQMFLGLALSIAPIAAWLAVNNSVSWSPILLAFGVLFWVSGFDIIYAIQDFEIDKQEKLHSLVVYLGVPLALKTAKIFHFLMLIFLLLFGFASHLSVIYFFGIIPISILLFYENLVAKKLDSISINQSFFTINAFISLIFLLMTFFEFLFR